MNNETKNQQTVRRERNSWGSIIMAVALPLFAAFAACDQEGGSTDVSTPGCFNYVKTGQCDRCVSSDEGYCKTHCKKVLCTNTAGEVVNKWFYEKRE